MSDNSERGTTDSIAGHCSIIMRNILNKSSKKASLGGTKMTPLRLDEHEMKFGMFSMPERWPWDNWSLSFDRIAEEAKLYDKLGYDEIWYGEHHSGGYENIPAPEMLIANIAPETDDINLATGAVATPIHDPFLVATRLAFLDQLTKGRLICGLGGASFPSDQIMFSVNDDTMRDEMAEAFDIIETYLNAEEPTSYEGEYWQYEDRIVQVPPYQDDLQFAMPGLSTLNSYETSGREGYIGLTPEFSPPRMENNPHVPSLLDMARALEQSAESAGRDPKEARKNWRIVREVYVAESKEEAIKDIRAGAEQTYDYLKGVGLGDLMKTDLNMSDGDVTIEWMIENVPWIIGSPEDCIKQIKALYEEVGGFGGLLFTEHDWVPSYKWERSVELFAREVMPAFQDNNGPRDWVLDQVNYSSPEPGDDVFKIENSTPRFQAWSPPVDNEYGKGDF
jgi:limonene 1,2-monooxygenase